MKRTLLIDFDYLLKRSLSANNTPYITKSFGDISGIFLFMLTFRTLVKKLNINKVVVMMDSLDGGKERYMLVRNYKGNRKNKSWYNGSNIVLTEAEIRREELKKESQLKSKIVLQNIMEELFIRTFSYEKTEADDLIAQYCKMYNEKEHIYIFTNDRDITQMVEYKGVNIILGNKKDCIINKDNFFLFFGFHYTNVALVKTMCGDSADNIYGIKGLGETTLLKHFPEIKERKVTIEEILTKTDTLIEERAKQKKKPLQVLENIKYGINSEDEELGMEFYENNYTIINLLEPFVTKECIHHLRNSVELPLDESDRGSKNLLRILNEIEFLTIWNGSFNDLVTPFIPTVLAEKELSKKSFLNE